MNRLDDMGILESMRGRTQGPCEEFGISEKVVLSVADRQEKIKRMVDIRSCGLRPDMQRQFPVSVTESLRHSNQSRCYSVKFGDEVCIQ